MKANMWYRSVLRSAHSNRLDYEGCRKEGSGCDVGRLSVSEKKDRAKGKINKAML